MYRTMLAGCALLLGGLFAGATATAQAPPTTGTGTVTYVPVTMETIDLPDGTKLQRSHLKGVVLATDANVPFHLSPQDCVGSNRIAADGQALGGAGYCDGVDRDGHVWWIWWKNAPSGNTWGFTGGSGKYSGVEGGGTTTPQMQGADGRLVIRWMGSWKMK